MKTKTVLAGVLVLALSTAVGCGDADGERSGIKEVPVDENGQPFDPAAVFSSEGLSVETQTADHVAGTFTLDGATLHFDFTREGETRKALLTGSHGEKLVESSLVGGIDSAIFLDGKAKITGRVDEEPVREGDPAVFDSLNQTDARIAPQMKEALIAAKVDRSLFSFDDEQEAQESGGVAPQSVYSAYNGSQLYRHLERTGDVYSFWSWSFWGTTTIVVGNGGTNMGYGAIDFNAFNNKDFRIKIQAGCCSSEYVSQYPQAGRRYQVVARQWWGAQIWVTNETPMTPLVLAGPVYRTYYVTECSGPPTRCYQRQVRELVGYSGGSPAMYQKVVLYHY